MSQIPAIDSIEQFIGDLYRARQSTDSKDFKNWALARLASQIPFDGALWGTGNVETRKFHSTTVFGVSRDYSDALEATQDRNPILPALLQNLGQAVSMSDVFPDRKFYQSDLYKDCFQKFGVERIVSVIETDTRSGIYTLLSLYRFDRNKDFTANEKKLQQRCAYHLVNAASHAFFSHIHSADNHARRGYTAICDDHGIFYEAQPSFLDLLEQYHPKRKNNRLPFEVPKANSAVDYGDLHLECKRFGDLYKLRLWETSPLDNLTDREKKIAEYVAQGLTFKEIGRKLNLAPSTVSNHMYRVYRKLGIASRSALADLVNHDK